MSDIVIQVENLSKYYRLGVVGTGTLSHDLNRWWANLRGKPDPTLKIGQEDSNGDGHIWALRDISFEVKQGEILGIIGRNGAGKSTLLKILSRVTVPTSGECRVKGRIASLLEVGTGFHPELTGRENIFLNGAILGMTKAEIKQKFDEIVAFSEVEKFIDTPVKRYSSGMYVRLAFAVAAHLEPEILIIDEVLAVGDAQFQKKCLGKMGEVSKSGRTVLFVSHNMAAVQGLCHRAILLGQGSLLVDAAVEQVIQAYFRRNDAASGHACLSLLVHSNRRPGSEPVLQEVRLFADGHESSAVRMGGSFGIEISFARDTPIRNMRFGLAIESYAGQRITALCPEYQAPHLIEGPIRRGTLRCDVPSLRLLQGLYYITVIIGSGTADLDRIDQAIPFTVESADVFGTGRVPEPKDGVVYQEANWVFKAG